MYNHRETEAKWQKFWQDKEVFKATENAKKPKFYGLVEFPYPSGDGLHTGHLRSYTALDIICRHKKMQGYEVLYPIGMDAFGLPTENYAIKTKTAPQKISQQNIQNFKRQLHETGYAFDWSKYLETTDPKYYRWTQWIFVKLWEKGLAYKAKETINWCTSCKIGLANEEVVNGVCERCGGQVVKKAKEQWMLKITKYADRLLAGLDQIDFLEKIKTQQANWIGKSQGAEIKFSTNVGQDITVFTTRPDTLFGVTFMVVSPELAKQWQATGWNPPKEVADYINQSLVKSELDRQDESREKTGADTGICAIHPVTGEELPVFVADYVLGGYGTGAIMAVPAHDARDFEFAKKFNLKITEVIEPLFSKSEGPDAVRTAEPFKKRRAVVAVIKHWSEDKYLCAQWKQVDWRGFVIGGIEDGEDEVAAALREIKEESGYINAKFVKKLGGLVHAQFYHTLKKENRWAHFQGLYFELTDDKNVGISEEEGAIQEMKWLSRDEVSSFLNVPDIQLIWQRVHGNPIYEGQGIIANSEKYNGLSSQEFSQEIIAWLTKNKLGKAMTNYRLRDWIFSRQRYWGEPIPMIYCQKCSWQPVAEKDLPVVLPEIADFMPTDTGESPLAKVEDWVNTVCPKCRGKAQRETDVMPNWAGSNWYFIRYIDPNNNKSLAESKKLKYWLPVDWYNGGMEHTTLHLLYSRFIFKFLYDIGVIPKIVGDEPYQKRTAQGMILGEGNVKMSKSKGNVVNPDKYIEKFGADATRLYIMFMGPFDQDVAWDDQSILGVSRFINKVYNLKNKVGQVDDVGAKKLLHATIKKVSEDIAKMSFNTAISQMMILANYLDKQAKINKDILQQFAYILAPFAPHIAEELNQALGNPDSIFWKNWPEFDAQMIVKDNIVLAIQVDGKVRDQIELPVDIDPSKEMQNSILARPKIQKAIAQKKIKKFIHIKNKIISIVCEK